MKLWVLLLLIFFPGILQAQKLDGVFAGELITQNNALVLTTKGETVNGSVYLTEYEKFTFMGNLKGDSLKGVILVPGSSEVVLLGRRYADSISATLHSNDNSRHVTLRRISTKANYNLRRYFGDKSAERDPQIVGKWFLVKSLKQDGTEIIKRKYFYDYHADGVMQLDIETLKAEMEEASRRNGSKNKFKLDERFLPHLAWRTSGQKLITTSESSAAGTSESEYTYQIKDDTLTLVNVKGGMEIMAKERKN